MAQNRDRNWPDRDQQQGSGQGHRGGWQGGEDFGQGERGQHQGSEDFGSGQGSWQGGSQQHSGDWGRMGRYGEEGRGSQGSNYGMDRDFGQSGGRGGGFGGGQQGQGGGRPFGSESSFGGSRGSWGGGSGGYGRGGGYGSSYGGSYGGQQAGRGMWDKASDEVSAWFGDDDARRRREQDEHRGRGPKGYTRSDERIREDVNDRLTDDGFLDASDIEVQVSSCEVTLTGEVKSREEKRRAEDIVESVSGVKHVQNNLRVKDKSMTTGQGSTTQFGAAGSGSSGSSGSAGKTSTGR